MVDMTVGLSCNFRGLSLGLLISGGGPYSLIFGAHRTLIIERGAHETPFAIAKQTPAPGAEPTLEAMVDLRLGTPSVPLRRQAFASRIPEMKQV